MSHTVTKDEVVYKDLHNKEIPDSKESYISLNADMDPNKRAGWPRQHTWLKEYIEKMHKFVTPKIKSL